MKFVKSLTAVLALTATTASYAFQIDDQYVGGNDHGYGDVIGYSSWFNVQGLNATRTGNLLTVDIYTNFVDHVGAYTNLTKNGKGIGFGDLFLGTEWNPYGNAGNGYKYDNASNGTLWTYGFNLNNRWNTLGGNGTLYALNGANNDANAKLSQDFMSSGIYRNGQEVAVDKASSTVSALTSGTWSVDSVGNKVSFLIDLSGTMLANSSEIAFHWGMTCGNDVIEGKLPFTTISTVPEPTSLALMSLALVALGMRRRKAA